MTSLNRIELIGRLANDPETRYTPEGRTATSFIADVENQEVSLIGYDVDRVTNSIPILAWGQLGELCREHLRKGSLIYLEGYLNTTKTKIKTTIHDEDDESGYEVEEDEFTVRVVAKKIELFEGNPQEESIIGNKQKILDAIFEIETSPAFPSVNNETLKALMILKSIDFETID